jgi:hypothetical protein
MAAHSGLIAFGIVAQKFGNGRWVKDGFLDNRIPGRVVGRITFAAIGPVDFFLRGDFKGEIQGQLITFRNPAFVDEDLAGQVLADLETPHTGDVSLMSFDPHPHLPPHPYLEWFSDRENHYRIELPDGAAHRANEDEARAFDADIAAIVERLSARPAVPVKSRTDSDWV